MSAVWRDHSTCQHQEEVKQGLRKEKRMGITYLGRKDMAWVLRAMNKKQTEWKKWCKKGQWEHRFKDQALSFEHHTCKEKSRTKYLFCVSLLPTHFVYLLLMLGSGKGNRALLLQAFQFNLFQFHFFLAWGLLFLDVLSLSPVSRRELVSQVSHFSSFPFAGCALFLTKTKNMI